MQLCCCWKNAFPISPLWKIRHGECVHIAPVKLFFLRMFLVKIKFCTPNWQSWWKKWWWRHVAAKSLTFMGLIFFFFLLDLWNDDKNCSFYTVWTLIGFHHHVSFRYQFFHSIYIGEHFLDCYSSDSKLMMSFVRKSCACWISDLKWKWHQMTWKIQIHQQTFKYIFIYEKKTNIETKIFLFQHFQHSLAWGSFSPLKKFISHGP